jgi:hypothetical protein
MRLKVLQDTGALHSGHFSRPCADGRQWHVRAKSPPQVETDPRELPWGCTELSQGTDRTGILRRQPGIVLGRMCQKISP